MEMTENSSSTVQAKFPKNLRERWRNRITTLLGNNDIKFFFAFSLIQVISISEQSADVVYWNPWVDTMFVTKWGASPNGYAIHDGFFVCGELLRGEAIVEDNMAPLWLRLHGNLLENQIQYVKLTKEAFRTHRTHDGLNYLKSFVTEEPTSLLAILARMKVRSVSAKTFIDEKGLRSVVDTAVHILKKSYLLKDKNVLAQVYVGADKDNVLSTVQSLPDFFIKTLITNWYVASGDRIVLLLSSYALPRLYISMNITSSGKIASLVVGDWVQLK